MIKRMIVLAWVSAAWTSVLAYSSLEELMTDMNRKQVEAIRAYIEANPEADDRAEARERLIYGLVAVEDYAGAIGLLEEMYKELPADKSGLDLSAAFGEVVVPMIQLYRMDGRKDDAMKFVGVVREEFKDHDMADTINEALDEFTKMFEQPGVGDELDIEFTAVDGREVSLKDLKGKVVLVDFWATWCVPCLKVMPDIKAVYDEFHDQGFEVVGISLDSEKEKLESYLAKEKIDWPHYFDGEGWDNMIAKQYGIESIPATFLIGPDGLIAATDVPASSLKARVAELLAAAKPAE